MNAPPNILFLSTITAPFVQDDLETLERHFPVRKRIGHGVLFFLKVILSVFQSDIVFCWFASVYASVAVAVARFAGIKSIIVLGGVDVSREEEYGYGIWLVPWKARLVRYAFRHADKLLVLAPSLKDDAMRLAEYDGRNIAFLPTGFDSAFWRPGGSKEPVVLTVAVAGDRTNVLRKGLDILIQTARMLPTVPFTVIGTAPEQVREFNPPANIRFLGKIPRRDLLPYYQKAKVYCHPSRREGLPGTLCEGMLCSCIPVATDTSGHPAAIGAEGILVPPCDPNALAEGIRAALVMPMDAGARARARIVALFAKETRERDIVHLIREMTN